MKIKSKKITKSKKKVQTNLKSANLIDNPKLKKAKKGKGKVR